MATSFLAAATAPLRPPGWAARDEALPAAVCRPSGATRGWRWGTGRPQRWRDSHSQPVLLPTSAQAFMLAAMCGNVAPRRSQAAPALRPSLPSAPGCRAGLEATPGRALSRQLQQIHCDEGHYHHPRQIQHGGKLDQYGGVGQVSCVNGLRLDGRCSAAPSRWLALGGRFRLGRR